MPPVEPPPSPWQFPPVTAADTHGLLGIGGDLEPGTLLAAYRAGVFPMPVTRRGPVGWWAPDPRGVIPLNGFVVSRSLRQSRRRLDVTVDRAFGSVLDRCARLRRPGGWITPEIRAGYERLRELGWAHSVEAWTHDGDLVGGLYGVAIGGLFAGESMFHEPRPEGRDASKVALAHLVDMLSGGAGEEVPARLLDVQWCTPHLASLGAVAVPRSAYQRRLARALTASPPEPFA